jgi:hypothetical protein
VVQNFATAVAQEEVGTRWVSLFLARNKPNLTSQWTTGMDRNRLMADTKGRYNLYFHLLHSKMSEYNFEAENTYNMDEKGFLIGITTRSERVFSTALWETKEVTAAMQDGNREWITLLTCVCADGTALEPALIHEGKGALQSSWVDDIKVGKHHVFLLHRRLDGATMTSD